MKQSDVEVLPLTWQEMSNAKCAISTNHVGNVPYLIMGNMLIMPGYVNTPVPSFEFAKRAANNAHRQRVLSFLKLDDAAKPVKTFQIWMEGFSASGDQSDAQLVGTGNGETFDDAVRDYMNRTPDHGITANTMSRYATSEAYEKRRSNWNIWACDLFDNEADARKSFG